MGSTLARLRVLLLAGALVLAVTGTARGAPSRHVFAKQHLGELAAAHVVGAVESAVAPETETSADETAVNPETDNNAKQREEYVKRGARNRLTAAIVLLAVVFGVLLFWWGWGKIHHRAPRL